MAKILSLEELAKHATLAGCWVAIHRTVYDLTPFVKEHPGSTRHAHAQHTVHSRTPKCKIAPFKLETSSDTHHSKTSKCQFSLAKSNEKRLLELKPILTPPL
ncbi:hypothetical protein BJ742DRAFT_775299 [Cladochytrium replicatum]|nr:hypothetical protein BJ742DRAFT_775299 [Cladochytrium replicatum]